VSCCNLKGCREINRSDQVKHDGRAHVLSQTFARSMWPSDATVALRIERCGRHRRGINASITCQRRAAPFPLHLPWVNAFPPHATHPPPPTAIGSGYLNIAFSSKNSIQAFRNFEPLNNDSSQPVLHIHLRTRSPG